jgi:hypothetical protein
MPITDKDRARQDREALDAVVEVPEFATAVNPFGDAMRLIEAAMSREADARHLLAEILEVARQRLANGDPCIFCGATFRDEMARREAYLAATHRKTATGNPCPWPEIDAIAN